MDDTARVRFDQSSSAAPRAAALGRVTVLDRGRWHAPLGERPGPRFVAVRGQAGVGKSTVAANLAIALASLRKRVVLIDLDLGHPTQHELFGIGSPVAGLGALLHDQIDTVEQALTPTAVRNLYIVSAAGAPTRGNLADVEHQRRLLTQLWELDADVVIADVGSDGGEDLVNLVELGALRLVVSAPNPTSIRQAYNFFKDSVLREVDRLAGTTPEGQRLAAAIAAAPGSPAPMNDLLTFLDGSPSLRAEVEAVLANFGGRLVGNHIHNSDEADLIHASSRLICDYLGISVPVLGALESSLQMGATRVSGRPLLLGSGIDRNVRLFHSMAEQLLVDDAAEAVVARSLSLRMASVTDPPTPLRRIPSTPGSAPLPASLGQYMRRHPRHPVDWYAIYRSDTGRESEARIFELSCSGASMETLPGLLTGDRGNLIFVQIGSQPEVPVTVVDVRRSLGRVALRFDGCDEVCAQLAATAAGGKTP